MIQFFPKLDFNQRISLQTSTLGQAYVVKGGINQHLISIVVEAYNTNVFNVFAYVYGI